MTGELETNTALSERKLADTLMMGRTPIREALRNLVREEVLEVIPARGTFVRKLTQTDIREIYEIRTAIEGMAARLAAKHGDLSELNDICRKFEEIIIEPKKHHVREIYDLGANFHLAVFRAAQNNNLYRIYQPLRLRFRIAFGLPSRYDHERVYTSTREHLEIFSAIAARDGDKAHDLIVKHLEKGLDARVRIFDKLQKKNEQSIAGNQNL